MNPVSLQQLKAIDKAREIREALRLAFHSLNPRGRVLLAMAFDTYTQDDAVEVMNASPDWFSATTALGAFGGTAWGWIRAQIDDAVGESSAPKDVVNGVADILGNLSADDKDKLIAMAMNLQSKGGDRGSIVTAITAHALKIISSIAGGTSGSGSAAAPRLIE